MIEANVNLATERASVRYLGGSDVAERLIAAVEQTGYGAKLRQDSTVTDHERAAREAEIAGLQHALLLAAILTLPVFVLEMGSHFVPAIHDWVMGTLGHRTSWYLQFALTTLVLFGPGLRFFRKGIPALLRRSPDMNSLVVLGTSAAYAYSVVATFLPGALPAGMDNVYYEAAAVIVTLILLGRYLEAQGQGPHLRGDQAPHGAAGQDRPRRCATARPVEVPLDQVLAGDIVQVRPGEKIPVDGEVVEGSSYRGRVDDHRRAGAGAEDAKAPRSSAARSTRPAASPSAPPRSAPTRCWPRSSAWSSRRKARSCRSRRWSTG